MINRLALRRLAIAAIFNCLLIASSAPNALSADTPASPSDGSIRGTLQQVLVDEGIQHDPPHPTDAPVVFHEAWKLDWLRYPLWVLLGIGAVALLWQVVKSIVELSRARGTVPGNIVAEGKVVHQEGPPPPAALPELDEIMALARSGDYEGAVHLLLLQGLRQLDRMTGVNLAPSLTSREILRRPGLPAEAGSQLATLVRAVEVSRFGGRPAGEAIFQACLDSYRRLAAAGSPAVGVRS
jgi:uncharacterized protein DUF4129